MTRARDRDTPLTQSRLKEVLHYDPTTGIFTRCGRQNRNTVIGSIAGGPEVHGYTRVAVDGHRYRIHRLAWFYMTGEWPENDIDHINGARDDNRWVNLRPATRAQNIANAQRSRKNTTGFTGVTRRKGKWRAVLGVNGRQLYLGLFASPQEASHSYQMARAKFLGQFARRMNP